MKNKLTLATEDATHFQVLLDETEKKLGTSQGELAAAKAELVALRDVVKSAGAASKNNDAQLAEVRGELARERQARVAAVEAEQARSAALEAQFDEQRHTLDAQIKAAERKANAAMKTAQQDRQLLTQAREDRDSADRVAADLRVEKDALDRGGADLREQVKFLRETVRQQKETIDQLRMQTPRMSARQTPMVVTKNLDGIIPPKTGSPSGIVTAQKMSKEADACAVEQVYVPPKSNSPPKEVVSPAKSVTSVQAPVADPARPGPLLVSSMGSPKLARTVPPEGNVSPTARLGVGVQPRTSGFTTPAPSGYQTPSMMGGYPGRPGPPPGHAPPPTSQQVAMHNQFRRANTMPQQPPNVFGVMDGRVNIQVSGMRRVR